MPDRPDEIEPVPPDIDKPDHGPDETPPDPTDGGLRDNKNESHAS